MPLITYEQFQTSIFQLAPSQPPLTDLRFRLVVDFDGPSNVPGTQISATGVLLGSGFVLLLAA